MCLIIISMLVLFFRENQKSQMYEKYLSLEFSNKYNELIANIFYIQEELISLENNMDNSNIASVLGERFYKVSKQSQDFDYFLTKFEIVDAPY